MPHRLPRTWTDDLPGVARRASTLRACAALLCLLVAVVVPSRAAEGPRAQAAAAENYPVPRPGSEPEDGAPAVPLPATEVPLPVPATGPVPVRILPQAFPPERVIQRFRLGPKVTEFMVVLYTPTLEGVRLRTPAGQLISADNIWRVGRWQTGQQLSVISLDWSAAGEWLVLAPAQVPVDVIVDPMLVPVSTPDTAQVGQPTVLRWQVQAAGRALDLSSMAELVVASARVVDERGGITDLAYAFEPNGVVSLTVPAQAAGVLTVETDVWLATFGQHVMHRLAVVPEPSVQVLGRRAAPMLIVRVPDAGLDTRTTRAVLDVRSSEGARQVVVGRREVDGSFRLQLPPAALGDEPSRARVVLGVDGMTRGGQPWHAPSRIVSLGTQGMAATRVLAADAGEDEASAQVPAEPASDDRPEASPGSGAAHGSVGAAGSHGGRTGWIALVLHPPGSQGPAPWQYGALGAANLVLIVLLWLRHRRRARAAPAAVAAAGAPSAQDVTPAAPAAAAAVAGRAATVAGAGLGAARVGHDEAVYDDRTIAVPSDPGPDRSEPGGEGLAREGADMDNLLEGLDIESLDDLAALAETQAEARARPRGTPPDTDPDVDAAA